MSALEVRRLPASDVGRCENGCLAYISRRQPIGAADATLELFAMGRSAGRVCTACAAAMVTAWVGAGGAPPVVVGLEVRGMLARGRRRLVQREARAA